MPLPDFKWGTRPLIAEGIVDSQELTDRCTAALSVNVHDPILSTTMRPYTQYHVHTTSHIPIYHHDSRDLSVIRRYSDFVWLHERLCISFPDIILPVLPPKGSLSAVKKHSAEFLAARLVALNDYMAALQTHPRIVSYSMDLAVFLQASQDALDAAKEWTAAMMKQATANDSLLSSVLSLRRGEGLTDAHANTDFVKLVELHKESLASLSTAVDVAKQVQGHHESGARALTKLNAVLQRLAAAERTGAGLVTSSHAVRKAAMERRRVVGSIAEHGDLPSSGGPSLGGDDAASAFMRHAAAAKAASAANDVDAMFMDLHEEDVPDLGAPGGSSAAASGGASPAAEHAASLPDMLEGASAAIDRIAAMWTAHLQRSSAMMLEPLAMELQREQELDAAAERHKLATAQLVSAGAHVGTCASALSSARSGRDDAATVKAQHAYDTAQKEMEARQKALGAITDNMRIEASRVFEARRGQLAEHLRRHAEASAKQCSERAAAWANLVGQSVVEPADHELCSSEARGLEAQMGVTLGKNTKLLHRPDIVNAQTQVRTASEAH